MNEVNSMNNKSLYEEARAYASQMNLQDLEERDQEERFSHEVWNQLAAFGYTGLPIAEAYNGKALSPTDTMTVLEAFGFACEDEAAAFSANAHMLSTVVPLQQYGSEALKETFLADLASGKSIAAHAISEKTGGSDTFTMTTKAIKRDGKYYLSGSKTYITNAPVADVVLVYVLTDEERGAMGGVTPFLFKTDRPGLKLSPKHSKMGLRTCLMGSIDFNNVELTDADILGQEGGGLRIFNDSMVWERIGMAAMMVGIIDKLIIQTKQYVKNNGLQNHQAVTHPIAQAKAEVEAIRALVYQAAEGLDKINNQTVLLSSSVKLLASELYKRFATEALQITGAGGYLTGNPIERSVRNAMAATLYSGSSEIQKNIILKHLNL